LSGLDSHIQGTVEMWYFLDVHANSNQHRPW
jgi:hypothetical protein